MIKDGLDPLTQVKESDIWEVEMNNRSLNHLNMFNPLKKHVGNTMSNTQTLVWLQLSFLAHELALGYFRIFFYLLLSFNSWCKCSCMVSPSLSQEKCKFTYLYVHVLPEYCYWENNTELSFLFVSFLC